MPSEDPRDEIQLRLESLRTGVRQVAHDISTPLGVLQMVAHYLQSAQPDAEQRDHYFRVITQNVAKVEAGLDRLRALTEHTSTEGGQTPPPPDAPNS